MTTIKRSAIVNHSPEVLYRLVNQVDQYPQFLPWCKEAVIYSQSDQAMEASMTLSKGPVEIKLRTQNNLIENQRIEMTLVEGPLKSLTGIWTFKALDSQSTLIELHMDFETPNSLLGMGLRKTLEKIGNKMIDAFCQRADDIKDQHDD